MFKVLLEERVWNWDFGRPSSPGSVSVSRVRRSFEDTRSESVDVGVLEESCLGAFCVLEERTLAGYSKLEPDLDEF